jgi:predicted nucleic acid-binding protein
MAIVSELQTDLVTTPWVLVEVADGLAGSPDRGKFDELLHFLRSHKHVTVAPLDQQVFDQGVELYTRRPDKDWSLTDCISFVVMREHGITDALTGDHHFEQAGFNILLG